MKKSQVIQNVISVDLQSEKAIHGELAATEAKAAARAAADEFFANNHGDFDEICSTLTAAFKSLKAENHFGIEGVKVSANSRKDKVTARMERAARFYHRAFKSLGTGFVLKGYNPFKITEEIEKPEKSSMEKMLDAAENLGLDKTGLQAMQHEAERQLARIDKESEAMKQAAREAAAEQKERDMAAAEKAAAAAVKALQKLGKSADEIAELTGKAAAN